MTTDITHGTVLAPLGIEAYLGVDPPRPVGWLAGDLGEHVGTMWNRLAHPSGTRSRCRGAGWLRRRTVRSASSAHSPVYQMDFCRPTYWPRPAGTKLPDCPWDWAWSGAAAKRRTGRRPQPDRHLSVTPVRAAVWPGLTRRWRGLGHARPAYLRALVAALGYSRRGHHHRKRLIKKGIQILPYSCNVFPLGRTMYGQWVKGVVPV